MASNPHRMTRDQMVAWINQGGSVLHGGRIITRLAELPSDAELSLGNPEHEEAAKVALREQIRKNQEALDALESGTLKVQYPGPTVTDPLPAIPDPREAVRNDPSVQARAALMGHNLPATGDPGGLEPPGVAQVRPQPPDLYGPPVPPDAPTGHVPEQPIPAPAPKPDAPKKTGK